MKKLVNFNHHLGCCVHTCLLANQSCDGRKSWHCGWFCGSGRLWNYFCGALTQLILPATFGTYSQSITGIGNVVLNAQSRGRFSYTRAKTDLTRLILMPKADIASVTTLTASSIDLLTLPGYHLAPGIYKSGSSIGLTELDAWWRRWCECCLSSRRVPRLPRPGPVRGSSKRYAAAMFIGKSVPPQHWSDALFLGNTSCLNKYWARHYR